MVPKELERLVREQPGVVERVDRVSALTELEKLGVPLGTQLAEFFLAHQCGTFASAASCEELVDVCSPTPELRSATEFVRDLWELPDRFLCLTTAEGEGAYLYDKLTQAVYDFSLADRDEFLAALPEPMAPDFFSFMVWYLSAPAA